MYFQGLMQFIPQSLGIRASLWNYGGGLRSLEKSGRKYEQPDYTIPQTSDSHFLNKETAEIQVTFYEKKKKHTQSISPNLEVNSLPEITMRMSEVA